MIETKADLYNFMTWNREGDWIVHVVPVEDGVHPATTRPSILFIKNLFTKKVYYYAFDHPDSLPETSNEYFIEECLSDVRNKWALDSKAFRQLLRLTNVRDANLCGFFKRNETFELMEYETTAHNLVRRNATGHNGVNQAIPLMKHKEAFEDMCVDIERMIKLDLDWSFYHFNELNHVLGDVESNGIFVDASLFEKHFEGKPNDKGLVFSQYNVYTATGRPSNRFGGINYAALKKDDGSRSCFISRHGKDGRMVLIDYAAFHPRIICGLTGYDLPVETDIYEYLSRLYFQKKVVDETDVANAKQITFRQLYGGVEDKYAHIKYLANLKTYIDQQWELFQKNGYAETPIFKRHITGKHITDPNPTKLFNYLLQAVEGEIAITQLKEVIRALQLKQTKPVLYTYDAVLYDFHKEDGIETLNQIRQIMSAEGKFPMKTYLGNSYHDVKQITI